MKKEMFVIFGLFLIFSAGLASAGWFDWVTGNVVDEDSSGYILNKDFGSIQINRGSIKEGANADEVDFISTLFSKYINGASAGYTIQEASYDKDISFFVAEFGEDISFSDFEKNYVSLLLQDENYYMDYDPASGGESLPDAQIFMFGYNREQFATYVWISKNKFIILSIEDFRSIEGIYDKENDFHDFLTSYLEKYPSTLVRDSKDNLDEDEEENYFENISDEEEQEVPSTSCQQGIRKSGSYCTEEGIYVTQKEAESYCDNNFECESNLCIDSKCISGSLWTKFMNWLKRIF